MGDLSHCCGKVLTLVHPVYHDQVLCNLLGRLFILYRDFISHRHVHSGLGICLSRGEMTDLREFRLWFVDLWLHLNDRASVTWVEVIINLLKPFHVRKRAIKVHSLECGSIFVIVLGGKRHLICDRNSSTLKSWGLAAPELLILGSQLVIVL